MPQFPLCAKCRQVRAAEGDSWCSGCSSWEFLGRELTASWDIPGARVIAGDLVVCAARQVKALRSLAAGESRAASSAGANRAELRDLPTEARASLPRRRSLPPAPDPKEEESSEGEEESEEEKPLPPSPSHRPLPDARPRSPDGPPPEAHRERRKRDRTERDAGRSRAHKEKKEHRRDRGDRSTRAKGRPRARGGRKHQRLYRLRTNPNLHIHRKPGPEFWDLTSTQERPLDLGQLGR